MFSSTSVEKQPISATSVERRPISAQDEMHRKFDGKSKSYMKRVLPLLVLIVGAEAYFYFGR